MLGLEADWSYTGIKATHDLIVNTSETLAFHSDLSSHGLATVRGRVGYAAGEWLLYGTGGLAIADLKTSDTLSAPSIGVFSANSSAARAGWTAGGGVEYAFSRAWSTKLEYLYVDVKGNNYAIGPSAGFPTGSVGILHDDLREHIVRAGINYHLGN